MPFALSYQYRKQVYIAASAETVLAFLKNYPQSLPAVFPGLRRFERQNSDSYFWEFEPLEYSGKTLEISFITRFEDHGHQIRVVPEPSQSDTLLRGAWTVTPSGKGATLDMLFELDFQMPYPSFLKSVVTPVAHSELTKLFDRYAKNVQQTLSQ